MGTAYAVYTCEQESPGMGNTSLKTTSALVLHRKCMNGKCWLDENRVVSTLFKYRTELSPTPKSTVYKWVTPKLQLESSQNALCMGLGLNAEPPVC